MPGNIISITPEDVASWPKPNYVDPIHRSWMPAYAGVLFTFGSLMVATRLTLRALKRAGGLGIDDVFLTVGWAAGAAFTALDILVTNKYGINRHIWDVKSSQYPEIMKLIWLCEMLFLLSGGCTKISVLFFYRRLVEGTYSRRWKWLVVSAIIFTASYTVALILTLVFNCTPLEAYWKSFDPTYAADYSCVDTTSVNVLAGLVSAFSDLYAVVLPCAMTWSFNLATKQKVALNTVFSLGLLVVTAGCVRTYYLHEVGYKPDVSWNLYNVIVWSQLELQLGLMCASAPAIRVLFRTYLSNPLSRIRSNSGRDHNSRQDTGIAELDSSAPRRISDPESRPNVHAGPISYGVSETHIRYSPTPYADRFEKSYLNDKESYKLQDFDVSRFSK